MSKRYHMRSICSRENKSDGIKEPITVTHTPTLKLPQQDAWRYCNCGAWLTSNAYRYIEWTWKTVMYDGWIHKSCVVSHVVLWVQSVPDIKYSIFAAYWHIVFVTKKCFLWAEAIPFKERNVSMLLMKTEICYKYRFSRSRQLLKHHRDVESRNFFLLRLLFSDVAWTGMASKGVLCIKIS